MENVQREGRHGFFQMLLVSAVRETWILPAGKMHSVCIRPRYIHSFVPTAIGNGHYGRGRVVA
jgi:hypothetical protein